MDSPERPIIGTILPRTVESYLHPEDGIKVKVLQGARAVGKTTVARRLVEQGVYGGLVSLADSDTLASADYDPRSFLRGLAERAIIDEAQLLPRLPLAVKELVDEPGTSRRILLTGSARIRTDGLGGSDPLTGRVERWVLHPLSTPELMGRPQVLRDMCDVLFGAPLKAEQRPIAQKKTPAEWITWAGLPEWSLGGGAQTVRRARINDWVDGVIGRGLEGESDPADPSVARRILEAAFAKTSTTLNYAALARTAEADERSVKRHLDLFERRFLVRLLPNLALGSHKSIRQRARLHVTDASLVFEALKARDPLRASTPEWLGQLFETWVVNQVLAALQFSPFTVDPFTWRTEKGRHEVDLVLASGDGRHVGIEVKSSVGASPQDARGLRALADAVPLHAGYVVHAGDGVTQLGERIWAVPVGLLMAGQDGYTASMDEQGTASPTGGAPLPHPAPVARPLASLPQRPVDAKLFLSYVREDDDYLGGAIVKLAEDLARAYRFQFGSDIEVFTDTASILWGQDWQRRIREAIEGSAFFVAAVTPSYLVSEACRTEFTRFQSVAESGSEPRALLPVIVQPIQGVTVVPETDPVRQAIMVTHWYDASQLLSPPGRDSSEYNEAVRAMASRLHDRVREIAEPAPPATPASQGKLPTEDGDLYELPPILDDPKRLAKELPAQINAFFQAFTAVVETLGEGMSSGTHTGELAALRRKLDPKVQRLEESAQAVGRTWSELTKPLEGVTTSPDLRDFLDVDPREWHGLVTKIAENLDFPERSQVVAFLPLVSRTSRMLRPAADAALNALREIDAIRISAQAWADRLDQSAS